MPAPFNALLCAVVAGIGAVLPAGRPADPADQLERSVSGEAAFAHLRAWQRAADGSGGTRATGTPGFEASARYLVQRLQKAGYRVVRQPVPYEDHRVDIERAETSPDGAAVRVLMWRWSPSTPPGGIDAPLVAPTADSSAGCEREDYEATPADGAVVLLPRASCGFATQVRVAAEAGARAVLSYMPTPRPDNIYRNHVYDPVSMTLPIASVTQRWAESAAERTRRSPVRIRLDLRGHRVTGVTENILAETSGGRDDRVVMAGAHLDSVGEAPGINDNGAAAAALLETALRLAPRQHAVRNKVRFAWWGAEELLDVGSEHYIAGLTAAQRRAIALYLNYELIAGPNFGRFVIDGDDSDNADTGSGPGPAGSGAVERVLTGYYRSRGLAVQPRDIAAIGSDHLAFQKAGIPIGGLDGGTWQTKTAEQAALFGGRAGDMFDPCYHQPCDTVRNIHRAELDRNTRAMAWTIGRFAADVDDVIAERDGSS
ncbi:M28 family peptidase [Actinomadura keratinilytica]|jgi:N-acetylated-alpha-linked acidic dipeptidase|uniref:M28 family metallopeptidase n=1 Tax=Actinomadura keratinilytica TaxID=547461 RepID=A0ABP7Z9C8_9ACTN